jgi:hypothetical protein
MIGEIDLYGILLPPLLVWLVIALPLAAGVRVCLNRIGFYRFVWHRPLFDFLVLLILVGLVSYLSQFWVS